MATLEPVNIECPECGSYEYASFYEEYDDEWISLMCECLHCDTKFQVNYRAVGIDKIKPDIKLPF